MNIDEQLSACPPCPDCGHEHRYGGCAVCQCDRWTRKNKSPAHRRALMLGTPYCNNPVWTRWPFRGVREDMAMRIIGACMLVLVMIALGTVVRLLLELLPHAH